ncbi:MAG: triose-phosphate isomerase [Candidatus Melainabacteria bacterium GWF2_37_15]|nr:MAG: triose-phosphate isomerase [Candidatus Melainabacteria bacterium GWF2_37_15]
MRKPIIAGNWKLNKTIDESISLVEDIKVKTMDLNREQMPTVVVCPVFTALKSVANILEHGKGIDLGAQDCYHVDSGAYTGEVSVPMLKDICVSYIIVGHSERRQYFGETDETVNQKAKAILSHGLIPIICCGESLEQREAGKTDEIVKTQVKADLKGLSNEEIAKSVIAYEPIWAIGTGKTCDSPEANRVIKLIRDTVAEVSTREAADKMRILYGGSVKASTIEEQMSMSDIDGALVGGASLEADSFVGIIKGTMLARTGK